MKENSLNWFLKRVGYPRQSAAHVLGLDYEESIKDGIPQHKARTYLPKGLEILMCELLWNKSTLIIECLFPEKDLTSGHKIQGFLNFSVLSIFRQNQESIKPKLANTPGRDDTIIDQNGRNSTPAISARDFWMLLLFMALHHSCWINSRLFIIFYEEYFQAEKHWQKCWNSDMDCKSVPGQHRGE